MMLSRKILRATGTLAALVCLSAAPATAAITDDLVGHWPLNETDSSSSAVANAAPAASAEDGNRTATMEIGQPSPVGSAYAFDGAGTDDYVSLGTAVVDELRATNRMTISAWINPAFLRAGSGSSSR